MPEFNRIARQHALEHAFSTKQPASSMQVAIASADSNINSKNSDSSDDSDDESSDEESASADDGEHSDSASVDIPTAKRRRTDTP